MLKMTAGLVSALALTLGAAGAQAQGTVKIGVIMPYSGQFADPGVQIDNGIKLYMKQHGDTVAGKKIVIIRKDVGGIAPPVAKRLAQELIVRDKVDLLTGFVLTPNAMAVGDVSRKARKFMVVMNAATSIITTKSPYMVRVSLTTPQLNETLGKWAAKNGVKKVFTLAADYGPGHDAEQAFIRGFKSGGGVVVGSVRFPPSTVEFSSYVQRAKDAKTDGIYVWVPGGAPAPALAKALADRGINPLATHILSQGELTGEQALKSVGKVALGIISTLHYDISHESAKNKAFVKAYRDMFKRNPDFFSVGGYDGMHLIYEVLKKTKGRTGARTMVNAAKGMSWESPRGPISIDPRTRDVVQTVYIRRVEEVLGKLVNVEFDKVANVKDPVHEAMMMKKKMMKKKK
jgi:branched-chain amino acid transport system substrate-binding protein